MKKREKYVVINLKKRMWTSVEVLHLLSRMRVPFEGSSMTDVKSFEIRDKKVEVK